MSNRPLDHWVCIPEDDLRFILDFDPERERTATRADLLDVIREIQGIVEEGLETW